MSEKSAASTKNLPADVMPRTNRRPSTVRRNNCSRPCSTKYIALTFSPCRNSTSLRTSTRLLSELSSSPSMLRHERCLGHQGLAAEEHCGGHQGTRVPAHDPNHMRRRSKRVTSQRQS